MQVKGGGTGAKDIRDLIGTVENQKAIGGILITLDKPTKPMRDEAASAGRFESKLWQKDYPKIQIVTIEGLLNGTERIDAPSQINPFAMAARESPRISRRRCCRCDQHAFKSASNRGSSSANTKTRFSDSRTKRKTSWTFLSSFTPLSRALSRNQVRLRVHSNFARDMKPPSFAFVGFVEKLLNRRGREKLIALAAAVSSVIDESEAFPTELDHV